MKTQHLNPEFGHTWGEIPEKKACNNRKKKKKTININGGRRFETSKNHVFFCDRFEFHPVFLFS